ncbi:organic hydroperoxide resistance protein [Kribbella sp. CA-253562]|uniref:organic hydroperoxide resistance protein n=1 Tax=Kribbella sp. CA-253562 TaxID=3239942 RepID=UPI003D915B92
MSSQYTAVATATGENRAGGRTFTDDGLLDVTLQVPKELGGPGGGTNPEQLFAVGWSSCFLGAVKLVAAQRKLPVKDLAVVAEITLNADGGEFDLSAVLHVEASGIDEQTAVELGQAAHQVCPYSKAVAGNIPVTIDATVA